MVILRMHTIFSEYVVNEIEIPFSGHHDGKIPIIEREPFWNGRNPKPSFAPGQDRGGTDDISFEQSNQLISIKVSPLMKGITSFHHNSPLIIDQRNVPVNESYFRMLIKLR